MTIDLANLRALAEAATPGPWSNDDGKRGLKKGVWVAESHAERTEDDGKTPSRYGPDRVYIANAVAPWTGSTKVGPAHANASFIAAADPSTVLALIGEIDRLEAERDARPAITPETAAAWKDNDTRAVDVIGRALRAHATKAVSR